MLALKIAHKKFQMFTGQDVGHIVWVITIEAFHDSIKNRSFISSFHLPAHLESHLAPFTFKLQI